MFLFICRQLLGHKKMGQINAIHEREEKAKQSKDLNNFETCEKIVENLIEKGITKDSNPLVWISKASKAYNISQKDATVCVKMAMKQLSDSVQSETTNEVLNGQTGYFWKTGYKTSSTYVNKNDGMDSLSSLGI